MGQDFKIIKLRYSPFHINGSFGVNFFQLLTYTFVESSYAEHNVWSSGLGGGLIVGAECRAINIEL